MVKTSTSGSANSLSPLSTTSVSMAAPPGQSSTISLARHRKKPGPKPKQKAPRSLIVKLKLSEEFLRTLKPSSIDTIATTAGGTTTPTESSVGGTSPQLSAEGAPESTTATSASLKRKGIPGPKPGSKRARVPGAPPGKPGRKKSKLDPSQPSTVNGSVPGVKLGPKANMGAINDKLRALDRSGNPCKRWSKAGFTLKSFTGVQWEIPTWAVPRTQSTQTTENSPTGSVEPSVAADTPPETKVHHIDTLKPAIPELSLPPGITV